MKHHAPQFSMRSLRGWLIGGLAAMPLWTMAQEDYTLHEWGTFTTVMGSDGTHLDGVEREDAPLPNFVYQIESLRPPPQRVESQNHASKGLAISETRDPYFQGARQLLHVNVRMETPVIYFYTDKAFDAEVNVKFIGGTIGQWYPERSGGEAWPTEKLMDYTKTRTGSIRWNVKVEPAGADAEQRVFRGDEFPCWLHPRLPDSALVTNLKGETEKYLFYRGLGRLDLPIRLSCTDAELTASNQGPDAIAAWLVFDLDKDLKARWWLPEAIPAKNASNVAVPFNKTYRSDWKQALYTDAVQLLIKAGLNRKEADAMMQTWWNDYFGKPGLRVFWLVPRPYVDQVLPLNVTPAPAHSERVIVGRAEMLTPRFEKQLVQDFTTSPANPWLTNRFSPAFTNRVDQLLANAKNAASPSAQTSVPRTIRGFDLANSPSHPATPGLPHALEIAELYGPDPADADKKKQKPEIFDLQVSGEALDPWVKIVPESGQFYIEFTDRTYGPIAGNPFEQLHLMEMLPAQLKSTSPDEMKRKLTQMLNFHDDILQTAAYALLPHLQGLDDAAISSLIKSELTARPDSPSAEAGRVALQFLKTRMEGIPKASSETTSLTVHEWGTFTVLVGSDGQEIEWYQAAQDLAKLPPFVQPPSARLLRPVRGPYPPGISGKTGTALWARNGRSMGLDTMRMETPVLYFYPSKEMDIQVSAGLAQGRITEVFPPARPTAEGAATWSGHLFPPNDPARSNIPAAEGATGRHYAAARNVPEAWLFRNTDKKEYFALGSPSSTPDLTFRDGEPVVDPVPPDTDHFIFYRGAGNASFALHVQEAEEPNSFSISNLSGKIIPHAVAIRIANGQTSWLTLEQLEPFSIHPETQANNNRNFTFSAPVGSVSEAAPKVREVMVETLTKEGLTPAEAAAMVATWDDLWFTEPGTRLLAILPQAMADALVPLKISPAPTELDRVFVARVEIISKAQEHQLTALLTTPSSDLAVAKKQFAELQLGRFANGGMERAMTLAAWRIRSQFQTLTAKP